MRRGLRAVADDNGVGRGTAPYERGDLGHGVDRAEGVRDVIEGDDARARREQGREGLEIEPSVAREAADAQLRSLT